MKRIKPPSIFKLSMLSTLLASITVLAGCGGGAIDPEHGTATASSASSAGPIAESSSIAIAASIDSPNDALLARPVTDQPAPTADKKALASRKTKDTTTASTGSGTTKTTTTTTATPLTLESLSTPPDQVLRFVGPTATCSSGFTTDSTLVASSPASTSLVGSTYSAADLTRWRARASTGPFIVANDYTQGSPGDWSRIKSNAETFKTSGENPLSESVRPTHGGLARDAAFTALVTNNASLASSVGAYLVGMTTLAANNFSTLCYRSLDGKAPGGDAWFTQAVWGYRFAVTYDLIKSYLDTQAKLTIENWLRLQGYFFAGQIDRDLVSLFPNRLSGDYTVRGWNVSPANTMPYFSKRLDTDGSCTVGGSDAASEFPIYAYIDAQGQPGPWLSTASQFYNNRRADLSNAFGIIGMMLGDEALVGRAKRYHMEWLTWAVYPDGSEGELARSGEYCNQKAGLVYAQANIQAALHLAHRLRVARGDQGLLKFSTLDGVWGTQVPAGAATKSLAAVVDSRLKLMTYQTKWYLPEPWLATQSPRDATLLAKPTYQYMKQGSTLESFHELGLLVAADSLPGLPIKDLLMRNPTVTSLPFPGTAGNTVTTGLAPWSDAKGVISGVYFWAAP